MASRHIQLVGLRCGPRVNDVAPDGRQLLTLGVFGKILEPSAPLHWYAGRRRAVAARLGRDGRAHDVAAVAGRLGRVHLGRRVVVHELGRGRLLGVGATGDRRKVDRLMRLALLSPGRLLGH